MKNQAQMLCSFSTLQLLGKPRVFFPNKKANHAEFCQKIEEVFPLWSTCGGYTLLKARGGRICKPLEQLGIYWFNFQDIKTLIVGTSRIYIKPIQRYLDMEMKKQICQMEFLFDDFLDTCIVKRV